MDIRSYNPNSGYVQPTYGVPFMERLQPMDRGKDFVVRFGKVLRQLMDDSADLKSIAALAKKSRVTPSTIDRAIRAESAISIDKLPDLAAAFGMKPWEMLKLLEPAQSVDPKWAKPPTKAQRSLKQLVDSLASTIPDEELNFSLLHRLAYFIPYLG